MFSPEVMETRDLRVLFAKDTKPEPEKSSGSAAEVLESDSQGTAGVAEELCEAGSVRDELQDISGKTAVEKGAELESPLKTALTVCYEQEALEQDSACAATHTALEDKAPAGPPKKRARAHRKQGGV